MASMDVGKGSLTPSYSGAVMFSAVPGDQLHFHMRGLHRVGMAGQGEGGQ